MRRNTVLNLRRPWVIYGLVNSPSGVLVRLVLLASTQFFRFIVCYITNLLKYLTYRICRQVCLLSILPL